MASRHPTAPSRVFLDASVLIAAAISPRGAARDLLIAGLRGRIELALGKLTIDETERNLARKFPAAIPVLILITQALPAELVIPARELVEQVAVHVTIKDAPIVAGAIHAQAPYLASYDRRHLLSQREIIEATWGVIVATPDDILRAVANDEPGT